MDGKMDSGYIPRDDVDLNFDPCAGLDANQVLWVLDHLLCLEIAWHDGYPLSQTLFTSLHLDRLLSPDNRYPYTLTYGSEDRPKADTEQILTHTVLRAYCIAVAKCCHMVVELIKSQNFYEEEDFVTHLFGRELLPRIEWNDADQALNEALDWLHDAAIESDVKAAIELRLRFRRSLLQSIYGEARDWDGMGNAIERMDESHRLGVSTPAAFTEKVQRELATSTPPRPMLEVSWEDACKNWTRLCADVAEAERLTSFWVRQNPACLQRAVWAFVYREPQPVTYARAVMQDLLFAEGKVADDVPHYDLLLTDIRELVLAGDALADPESFQVEMPSDPRHVCSRLIEGFMDKVFDEYLNLYRMVCQNRCRIRRTFTQALPLWNEIELTLAADADREINAIVSRRSLTDRKGKQIRLNPLTSWARNYKLKLLADTITLGFETDIYLPDEHGQMYALLALYTTERETLLKHIALFLQDRVAHLTKSRDARYLAEAEACRDYVRSLQLHVACTHSLASALWKLYGMLLALELINTPKRPYAKTQLLYEARMKPYFAVTDPSPTSVVEFSGEKYLDVPLTEIYATFDDEFKSVKQNLGALKNSTPQQARYVGTEDQWKREIKQLETTCVAIAVAVSQLRRMCEKYQIEELDDDSSSLKGKMEVSIPAPGKRYHDWWVVPQLKEIR